MHPTLGIGPMRLGIPHERPICGPKGPISSFAGHLLRFAPGATSGLPATCPDARRDRDPPNALTLEHAPAPGATGGLPATCPDARRECDPPNALTLEHAPALRPHRHRLHDPAGVKGCSHGWSEARRQAGEAQPVDNDSRRLPSPRRGEGHTASIKPRGRQMPLTEPRQFSAIVGE